MALPRHRGLRLAACALGAALAASCGDPSYRLVLSYPDDASYQRASRVALFIGEGKSCSALQAVAGQPHLEFDAQGQMPELGRVAYGRTAFRAAVRDGDCLLFLDGCSDVEIEPDSDLTIRISLTSASGGGCAAGERCASGRCLGADAGTRDATAGDSVNADRPVIDAGRDAGRDAATDAARDAAHDATVVPDGGPARDAGRDAGPDAARDAALPPDAADDAGVPETLVVEPVYRNSGANWNDWVVADGSGPYGASDSPCNRANWNWCLHGGELRRVQVDGPTLCSGRTVRDELGVMNWSCTERTGGLTFYSTGLPAERRLADLVDVDHWRLNRVSYYDGATLVARSGWRAWWSNPVVPLPDNAASAAISLDDVDDDAGGPDRAYADGTIFTLTGSRTSNGYNIGLDRAAIAMPAGAQLTYSGLDAANCSDWCAEIKDSAHPPNQICLVAAGNQDFLWLEGDYLGPATPTSVDQNGIYCCNVGFSKLRSVRLARHLDNGFIGDYLHFTEVSRSQAVSNGGSGILLIYDSDENWLSELAVFNNGDAGVIIYDSDDNAMTSLISVGNGGPGLLLLNDAENNMLGLLTLLNNGDDGLVLADRSVGNTLFNLVSGNNGGHGILIDSSTANHLSQVGATANATADVVVTNGSSDNVFSQLLLVGGTPGGGDCVVSGGSGNNIATDCVESDPELIVDADFYLLDSFVGLVRDSVNGSTAALASNGTIAFGSIADWLDFENPFRGWASGVDVDFLGAANASDCIGGTCAQRDVTLAVTDSEVRNVSGLFRAGQTCPASVHGDMVWPDADWILINAVEILGDFIGNDDLACEHYEACLYLPNLGAYQGSGDFTQNQCQFVNGTIHDVTMYAYPVNGG